MFSFYIRWKHAKAWCFQEVWMGTLDVNGLIENTFSFPINYVLSNFEKIICILVHNESSENQKLTKKNWL